MMSDDEFKRDLFWQSIERLGKRGSKTAEKPAANVLTKGQDISVEVSRSCQDGEPTCDHDFNNGVICIKCGFVE